jgi:hypothetical protein
MESKKLSEEQSFYTMNEWDIRKRTEK